MTLFVCPPEHQAALEEVKAKAGITHNYLDGWVYLFLSNKKFDVKETLAKLVRRDDMERNVFSKYVITSSLQKSMRAGIIQYIGRDKEGRPVLYFNTVRDNPKAEQRPERQANLDMFLGWAVRCDPQNPTSTVTWLINQKDASLLRNTDLIFQKDMALRISKFFPNVVARMYICNMSSALTFVMRPLLKQLPSAISDCIFMFSSGDVRSGKLLERIDASVLPVAMGGKNDCDNQANYEIFASNIESYFDRCVTSLNRGVSIKQMEIMEAYAVDKDGKPGPKQERQPGQVPGRISPRSHAMGGDIVIPLTPLDYSPSEGSSSPNAIRGASITSNAWRERVRQAAEEDLELADDDAGGDGEMGSFTLREGLTSACTYSSSAFIGPGSCTSRPRIIITRAPDDNLIVSGESGIVDSVPGSPTCDDVPARREMMFFSSMTRATFSASDMADVDDPLLSAMPVANVQSVEGSAFDELLLGGSFSGATTSSNSTKNDSKRDKRNKKKEPAFSQDELMRDWVRFRCLCVELSPALRAITTCILRASKKDSTSGAASVSALSGSVQLLRSVAHHTLALFPATTTALHLPLSFWLSDGLYTHEPGRDNLSLCARYSIDCTSPDNVLLSVQGAALEYVDECEQWVQVTQAAEMVLCKAMEASQTASGVASVKARIAELWQQLTPLFHKYSEAKITISIADFISYFNLLAKGGMIDTTAEWYTELFAGIVQYRELRRHNWLFRVFPPLFTTDGQPCDGPPTAHELMMQLHPITADQDAPVPSKAHQQTLEALCLFSVMTQNSVQATSEQVETAGFSTRALVERYLEETLTKVYIPYATQRHGCTVDELAEQGRQAARESLVALEAPLAEFLKLTAVHQVLATEMDGEDAPPLQMAVMERQRRVVAMRNAHERAMQYARCAYDMQGTFLDGGDDTHISDSPPDGYFLGLELLFVVACCEEEPSGASLPAVEPVPEGRASTEVKTFLAICGELDSVGERIEAVMRAFSMT